MQTTYRLHVYQAPSGQFSGRLFEGDSEVLGVAGYASISEVEDAVMDAGYATYELLTDAP